MHMNSSWMMRAGLLLRVLRLRAGLGQDALADATGASQSTVSRWEQGLAVPDRRQVEKWFAACRASDSHRDVLVDYLEADTPDQARAAMAEVEKVLIALVSDSGSVYDTTVPYFADVA